MAAVGSQNVIVFILVMSIYITVTISVFYIVFKTQPGPYMDEIYHIPQAQKYCEGNFSEWDKKITTPPGLYLISVGILVPLSKLTRIGLCDIFHLRLTNLLFSIGNFYLIFALVCRIQHKGITGRKLVFSALNMAIFPLVYFFTFLYYTDAGSLFFVLLMYLFHLHHSDWTAAGFGALSILFRQTNVVWVFFVTAQEALSILSRYIKLEKKDDDRVIAKGSAQYLLYFTNAAIAMPFRQKKRFINAIIDVLTAIGGYILVGIAFIAFIIYNHSVALGDKEAHQVCFNIPQIGYFLGFTLCFASPYMLTLPKIRKCFHFIITQPMLVCIIALLSALAVQYLTYTHPYLLADNRHFTFYIWKRILGHNTLISCLLIPGYIYSGWTVFHSVQQRDALWKFVFAICVIAATVPQKLLEFRYFIIPYIIYRIHIPTNNYLQLIIEFVINAGLNCATLYLFLYKPFMWNNELQRFMW